MTYFISDLHLGHFNIIKYSDRPFSSVEDMNEYIINCWNNKVHKDDTVYILGDVCFRVPVIEALQLISQLKGKKNLVKGNHDFRYLKSTEFVDCFDSIHEMLKINVEGERLILCHYPILEWDCFHRGAYHFYGHIHNRVSNTSLTMNHLDRAYNVGCDVIGYVPLSLKEIVRGS